MRNKKWDTTTDTIEIQKILRDYYKEQLYDNKLYNPEEMDQFPETQNFPRLNQEQKIWLVQ